MLARLIGSTDRRLLRLVGLVLWPALLVVTTAVIVAATATDAATRKLFDNVHWTTGYLAGAALAWIGARHAEGDDVRPRRCLAWALSAYAVGQILWDLQVASGWNPFPGPSDAFFILLGPLSGLAFFTLLRTRVTSAHRRVVTLDIAALSAAVVTLTLALYLPRRGVTPLVPLSVLVAYPVVLCSAAITALVSVLALQLQPQRGWIMVLAALLVQGGLWLEWNARTLDGALQDGGVYNALFSFTAILQGLGALTLRATSSSSARWRRLCDGVLRLSPLLVVIVTATAVVLVYLLPEVPPTMRNAALAGGGVVVLLATIRQSLMIFEGDRLIEAERQLRRSEERYVEVVKHAGDAIFLVAPDGRFLDVNPRGAAMLGMTAAQVLERRVEDVVIPRQVGAMQADRERMRGGETIQSARQFLRLDGSEFPGEVTARKLPDGTLLALMRDVSERVALEAQLRQAQKMEAVGQLAGGIAHDFNNILTSFLMLVAGLRRHKQFPRDALGILDELESEAMRAANLSRQMLTFSRRQLLEPRDVELNALLDTLMGLLRRVIGEDVSLELRRSPGELWLDADAGMLEQVVVNLAVNARDAMPRGGPLVIATDAVTVDETRARLHEGARAGRFVRLAVQDAGTGMDAETMKHIFEPFFTTKGTGKGTGLGLSTVYGIVRQHQGWIEVETAPGRGTTFSILLPAHDGRELERREPAPARSSSPARILFAEDEPAVRLSSAELLRDLGHEVVDVASGPEAVAAFEAAPGRFDLLVTDMVMPGGMTGPELCTALRARAPDLRVLFVSGYPPADGQDARAPDDHATAFLQKPYSIDALADRIGELLRG